MTLWQRLRDPASAPSVIILAVGLLLLAGFGVIVQNESAYREMQRQETRVQAEILAASVSAALDFGDPSAIQEAVNAVRVNRQVRTVGIYAVSGALVAGYGRDGADPPSSLTAAPSGLGRAVASTVPVQSGGERIGSVLLATDPEPLSARLARYFVMLLLVVFAALVVGVLGFAQAALRRANLDLEDRARALADANVELKIQIGERAKAEDQLRQAQKLQALGQLTGGIAHDFNNLLTVIQGSADMLRRPDLADSRRVRFAEAIVQSSARAAALTGQLLAFARRQPLQPEVIDLNALIRGMVDLLDRTLGERIKVSIALSSAPCTVEADRAQLESAVLNVAVNARDAMPGGGELTIRTSAGETDGGDMIELSVSDTGVGMDAETLSRAIEPFFTTKQAGKGTGLGLSQVYGFATQSGGDVRIQSHPGRGTTITLLLPRSRVGTAEAAADAHAPVASRASGRILLVEDNEEVGEFAEVLLDELGYEVSRVTSAPKALDLVRRQRFDAVFSDVVMPGMSGLELADELARERPDLPVVLTTGYSDEIAQSGTGGRPVVLKPYRLETLASVLDQVLSGAKR